MIASLVLAAAFAAFAQSTLSVKEESVTLYTAPGSDSYEVATLKRGDIVEVLRSEYGSDWLYVSFRGKRGYVMRAHLGDGEEAERRTAEIASEVNKVVDDHVAKVISGSRRSSRSRPLEEISSDRTVAFGDLDGDGDDDIASAFVIGTDGEPRFSHVALFANDGSGYRLLLDERVSGGSVRVAGIESRQVLIERSGFLEQYQLLGGRLARVESRDADDSGDDVAEVATVDYEAAPEPAEETDDEDSSEQAGNDETPPPPPPSTPDAPNRVSKGVLNGTALDLPVPEYPAAARAVNASGTVNVSVVIDEQGTVVSANAVSGHPLLRQAAVAAAQQARFSPTYVDGLPVQVSGVIVYNFQPPG